MPHAPRTSDAGSDEVLSPRALNRALLARQALLARDTSRDALTMVHALAGLQAQNPLDPYYALWSRMADFDPAALASLLESRQVARAPLLRTTIHLVTAADCLAWRPLTQPILERVYWSTAWGQQLRGIETARLLAAGEAILSESPRTGAELAAALAPLWPDHDPAGLSQAVRYMVPLVQVPPRGVWGQTGRATWAPFGDWFGAPLAPPDPAALVLRHIAAFGPVSVMDTQNWSGLTKLGEVFARLRPALRVFRAASGAELFDLPDAPRSAPDVPAPPRFFPEYDNVFLGHADRTRIIPPGTSASFQPGYPFTVDGFVAGSWKLIREKRRTRLRIAPIGPLPAAERDALLSEAVALLSFAAPGAEHDIDIADMT